MTSLYGFSDITPSVTTLVIFKITQSGTVILTLALLFERLLS